VRGLYDSFVYKLYGWPTELALLLARLAVASLFWHMGPQRYLPWPEMMAHFKPLHPFATMPIEGATGIMVFITLIAPLLLAGGLLVRLTTLPLLGYVFYLFYAVKPELWPAYSLWAALLLLLLVHGSGRFSADAWLRKS